MRASAVVGSASIEDAPADSRAAAASRRAWHTGPGLLGGDAGGAGVGVVLAGSRVLAAPACSSVLLGVSG
jgi:hypothetical protein